jgi:(p)ppGpp synthase/HD superfamily hydrolase
MLLNMSLVDEAREFAKAAHERINHKRKYTGESYFVHLEEVAGLVQSVGGDDAMIAAAFLHDTVEDVKSPEYTVTLAMLEAQFGSDVSSLVEQLTDVSQLSQGNRSVRKAIDLAHTAQASARAKTIKLADLISNSRSIVQHDKAFAKMYIAEKERLLVVLKEGNPQLMSQAQEIVKAAKLILGMN